MERINFENNVTKANADTFNTMQDNIEDGINDGVIEAKNYTDELQTYSTTETRIGTWIDGKPLYRKVFTDTMPQVQTDGTFVNKQIDISSLNVEYASIKSADFIGYPYGEISVNTIPTLNPNNLSQGSVIDIYGGDLEIRSNRTIWNVFTFYVVLEYTKTTD